MHFGRDRAGTAKPHLARRLRRRRAGRSRLLANDERRNDSDRREAQADELHRLGAIVVTIGLRVMAVECLGNSADRGGIDRATGNRHVQFVRLTGIARIDGAIEAAPGGIDPGPLEHGTAFSLHGAESRLENGRVGGRRRGINRAHVVTPQVGANEAQGRERSRDWRTNDGCDAQLLGERRRVQGAGATECRQGEVARIVAALHRDDLQRFRHGIVDDIDDGGGGSPHVDAERDRQPLLDCGLRGLEIQRHGTGKQRLLAEIAQHQVAVGHSRLGAATAIADGAGLGARTLRPHAQGTGAVDPGDRAAAGGNLGEVDHRHADRMPGAANLVFRRGFVFSIANQAGLRGGAAHVERQEVQLAGLARNQRGADDPGRRTGLHRHRRHGDTFGGFEHATVRAHQVEPRQTHLSCRVLELRQVGTEDGPDIGADGGRAGALELADLRQHFGREIDGNVRKCRPQPAAEALLVRRIEEAEQQRDRNRFHVLGLEIGDQSVDLRLRERRRDLPVGADAFRDLESPAARRQGCRRVLEKVIEIAARGPPQFQDIAKATRRDKADASALFLEQRIGDDGRGMAEQADVDRRDALRRGHRPGEVVEDPFDDLGLGQRHTRRRR